MSPLSAIPLLAEKRCRGLLATALLAAFCSLVHTTTARGEFGAPALLSGTEASQYAQPMQFEFAESPAFAREGGYIAFRGSLAGAAGVYRRDLQTGEIELVAGAPAVGASAAEQLLSAPDATAPSISAEGRYVAFTSAATLVPICGTAASQSSSTCEPDADRGCPQVYVRDMGTPGEPTSLASPDAYTLVSARGGTGEGLTYAPGCQSASSGKLALAGAQAAAGVAMSENGRSVAFTVLSPSNLTGSCSAPPSASCPTEPSQVAVRDWATKTTTLVTATPEGLPTPGGGAYPSAVSESRVTLMQSPAASSAAISADGSTVAWEGTNVPAQVPSATDVTEAMARDGGPAFEVEPLWRRVADGTAAETQRLLAGAGLNFYSFGLTNLSEGEPPVRGGALALEPQSQDEFIAPALSESGETVATIANAFTTANEASYTFVGAKLAPPADAYLVRVDEAPGIAPQVTPLTATPDYALGRAMFDGVRDVAISPDGTRVAFNTARVSFALAPPSLISPPAQETVDAYTYVADLPAGTLERVTNGYEGAPPDGEPGLLSLAGDDLSLAFSSAASNLFFGDGTPGASQVYLSREVPAASVLASESMSPAPALPVPALTWMLSATATPQRDGGVLVEAEVPGAGTLQALAVAQLPLVSAGRHARTSARRAKTRAATSREARVELVDRTVARSVAIATDPGELRLRLGVDPGYSALVAGQEGLYVVLHLSFSVPGHETLVEQIPVTLHDVKPKKPSRRRTALARRRPGAKR
jgi:hypothetical protein